MPLLQSDLVEIFNAMAAKKLGEQELQWRDGSAVTVILASEHYPIGSNQQENITGLEKLNTTDDSMIFHAATLNKNGQYYTNGGRVLGATAIGKTLADARSESYRITKKIDWEGVQYRNDIAYQGDC